MEYLLLGHLTSIPFPAKKHASYHDDGLLFVQTDAAFVKATSAYLPYFYNCQFPKQAMEVIRISQSGSCRLSGVLRIEEDRIVCPDGMRSLLEDNVRKLMQVVNICLQRFGENNVLV